MMKKIFIIMIAMLAFASLALAQTDNVTINWVYPTELEGSIIGFRIYYGITSQAAITDPVSNDGINPAPYDAVVEITDPTIRSHTLTLTPDNYFTRLTVFGLIGGTTDDSAFSPAESQCFVGLTPPSGASCTVTYILP